MVFKCINCGSTAAELICEGATSRDTIELQTCEKCGKHLDKYLEYDVIIVILDMILMKRQAYRHILYNTSFEKHWRMAVLIILVQGFYDWATKCADTDHDPSHIILYNEKIYGSFLIQMAFFCLLAFAESLLFMVFTMFLLRCYWTLALYKPADGFSLKMLWKAMVLGCYQQFFLIAPLIWQMESLGHFIFVIQLFQFLSIILVLSVVCDINWIMSAIIVGCGALAKIIIRILIVVFVSKTTNLCADLSL